MNDVKTLLALSDDELLQQLGREVWAASPHANPPTKQSLIQAGQDWLKQRMPDLRAAVCGNPVVAAIRDKSDVITLATTVTDVVLKLHGIPVPSTVAVLIVKLGVERLCQGWQLREAQ